MEEEEKEKEKAEVETGALMDFDFDLASSFLISSSSSPTQSFLHLPMASPPSPLWLFEDRPFDVSSLVMEAPRSLPDSSNSENRKNDGIYSSRQIKLSSVEDSSTDSSCLIKERIAQALRHFKDSTNQHLLVQVWAPVKNGERYVLTTSGQPFVLDPQSIELLQYRTVSLMYMFSIDGDNDTDLGLPGRVYRQKVPEWTPNVQFYSSMEYPRLTHALSNNVRGTVALPVFEPSAQSCVAVIELIMTSQKINYASEVDKVCKALEAVNLKSTEILDHTMVKICNEGRQSALVELLETLTVVCEEHSLPLAQTWVPCRHRSVLAQGGGLKKSCSSFDNSCMEQVCMSTSDVAFHVIDAQVWGFRDACVEHHLKMGQGVAGRAFVLRKPCFSRDITQFSKTEYPLVHYARMFGLTSCLAICLQSAYTGTDDYILEFFLPPDCKGDDEKRALLKSMTTVMKRCFRGLKVIGSLELQEISLEGTDTILIENQEPKWTDAQGYEYKIHESHESNLHKGLHEAGKEENKFPNMSEQQLLADDKSGNNGKTVIKLCGSGTSSSLVNKNNRPGRRRGKAEKTISLDVLQQYFSGSLKSASKSLGVCPTTMKRICRQHGISRWPSRKINKVNRSLSKLKQVIESVQGPGSAFKLTSITGPLPIPVDSLYMPANIDKSRQIQGAKTSYSHDERDKDFKSPDNEGQHAMFNYQRASFPQRNDVELESGNNSHSSRSRSSFGEDSTNNRTSEGSCQGSPANDNFVFTPLEPGFKTRNSPRLTKELAQDPHKSVVHLESVIAEPQSPLGGMLIEDSGSSKDLKDLCSYAIEGCHDDNTITPSNNPTSVPNLITVTIKASYKNDIIRFRFPCSGSVGDLGVLKDEVAKRLKMEVGLFDIKYLDDDHEWVMLACDADLEECMEISRLSGGNIIRLSVNDIVPNVGSCESHD
ncbi:protein NLP3 [Typha angustifolia]|uniref:protein NLP3 n=1 Tax=Typha angustifolia TaxID=59011 RepID=UPI003C2F60AE